MIVSLSTGEKLEFDFLIYTAPHAHSNKIVVDLSPPESAIFDSLSSYVLSTTIYTSDSVPHYSSDRGSPIMYNVDKMSGAPNDGEWYADRNDMEIFGNTKKDVKQMRVGYQFFEDPCAADKALCDSDRIVVSEEVGFEVQAEEVRNKFMEEMERMKVDNVQVRPNEERHAACPHKLTALLLVASLLAARLPSNSRGPIFTIFRRALLRTFGSCTIYRGRGRPCG